MERIFAPRWEKGAHVERVDTGQPGTLTGDFFGGAVGVKWKEGETDWVAFSLLRLVPIKLS